jgi:ubiquinone/menaquinone biosynthesis C-methylase UbiE
MEHQEQKARVQASFAASARAYVKSPGHAAGEDLDYLVRWASAHGGALGLDVATGGGHTALAMAGVCEQVIALDFTIPMLEAARQFIRGKGQPSVRFVAGDVNALPFPDGAFDLASCRIAPHHFSDVPGAAREISRVLKPGAEFLLQDILGQDDPELAAFITDVERRRDPTHVRAYRRDEWRGYLEAAGLRIAEEAIVTKEREFDEWTARVGTPAETKADLERFILAAPPRYREAFDVKSEGSRLLRFSDRYLLVRGQKL